MAIYGYGFRMSVTVARWGDNLAVRIPYGLVAQECLKEGDALYMEAQKNVLRLEKVRHVKKYSIEDALAVCHTAYEVPEVDFWASGRT